MGRTRRYSALSRNMQDTGSTTNTAALVSIRAGGTGAADSITLGPSVMEPMQPLWQLESGSKVVPNPKQYLGGMERKLKASVQ